MKLDSVTIVLLLHCLSPCTLALNYEYGMRGNRNYVHDNLYRDRCDTEDLWPCIHVLEAEPLVKDLKDVIENEWTPVGGMLPGPLEDYQVISNL